MTSSMTSFRQLQRFPENTESSLEENQIQHSNSRKVLCTPNHVEMRADSLVWCKRYANFPQEPQEQASLSNKYVRGTLCLLPQVESRLWCPVSKESQISLPWLECRLVFHLTWWSDVWIPCGEHRESPWATPHLYKRPDIPLTPREAGEVQCFLRWQCLTPLDYW